MPKQRQNPYVTHAEEELGSDLGRTANWGFQVGLRGNLAD